MSSGDLRTRVEALHREWYGDGYQAGWHGCLECRKPWPCPTIALLDADPDMPTADAAADTDQAMSPETSRRLIKAAGRPLRLRRNVINLAAVATGHRRHPHDDSCETCKERWPCAAIRRAISPILAAVDEMLDFHDEAARHLMQSQVEAARADTLNQAEAAFDQMWGSGDWDGQVSIGFASTFSQEIDRLRGRAAGEG